MARKVDGQWVLSREPEPEANFFAIRFGAGMGWSAEQIFWLDGPDDTLAAAVSRYAEEFEDDDATEEHIAVGVDENGWVLTLHHGQPPYCTAERAQ